MAAQIEKPRSRGDGPANPDGVSFFYHLGDIVYKPEDTDEDAAGNPITHDQGTLYREEFYAAYACYGRPIFAVPGNHDGKVHLSDSGKVAEDKSPVYHFARNFSARRPVASEDNPDNAGSDPRRATMTQPHFYWTLETPAAAIIGLFTNVINGGQLDSPGDSYAPQYHWLVKELKRLREADPRKPLLVACHYPPFSGAANFRERGDPNAGPTPRAADCRMKPLAALLQAAYDESEVRPDAVFSAHAHLYQRITYTYADGYQIPYLVAGCGGHAPVEPLSETCADATGPAPPPPLPLVLPPDYSLPTGDHAAVVSYNDRDFGFLRVTVDDKHLRGEFFAVPVAGAAAPEHATYPAWPPKGKKAFLYDAFTLRLESEGHVVRDHT
jgi:hypothetical protein